MSSHGCHIDSCIDNLLISAEKFFKCNYLITSGKKERDDAVEDGNAGLANVIEQDIEYMTDLADIHSKAVDAFCELIKEAAQGE